MDIMEMIFNAWNIAEANKETRLQNEASEVSLNDDNN